mgnify:CR=1 FL=1|jgi:hypothetical protein
MNATSETHRLQVLRHLQNNTTITPIEALAEYNCYRLAARIYELRQAGYMIETTMKESEGDSYACYIYKGKR